MNKTTKIIYWVLITIIAWLTVYWIAIQPKVKAWNDLIQTQARLDELEILIEDAKLEYSIAEQSKQECIDSWNKKKDKAHDDAEKYRIEKAELEGFLLNR